MSSKTRMLGAGRAGSTAYGSNVNLIQFGDRLQGLAPQATHFFISGNGRAGWNQYQTRTNAPKRNSIFCMNQLGGVGRGKSQFKVGGLNKPDGAKICKPHEYQNPKKMNNKSLHTNSVDKSLKGSVYDNKSDNLIERENVEETQSLGIKDINLLVCTHGDIGSGFWDEVDMAFIELQKFYGFKLTIERFGESATNQVSFLNDLNSKVDIGYNAICSTVLSPEIGEALRPLTERVPLVTYNTSVSSLPYAIEYIGSGSLGEESQGYDLAIQMGMGLLGSIGDNFSALTRTASLSLTSSASSSASSSANASGSGSASASTSASASSSQYVTNLNVSEIKNNSDSRKEFIEKINQLPNLLVITFSQDVDNNAFTERHTGVTRIFENAIYFRDFEKLKTRVSEHISLYEGKIPIVLGLCLQESVLDTLNDFLKTQANIIYMLGVTDITSDILARLKTDDKLSAVSGSPPISQGNLVAASLLNKVYGIFKGNISNLKKYTPIGNPSSMVLTLGAARAAGYSDYCFTPTCCPDDWRCDNWGDCVAIDPDCLGRG
jgi:hypothetical protein